jgi:hypothetical protein
MNTAYYYRHDPYLTHCNLFTTFGNKLYIFDSSDCRVSLVKAKITVVKFPQQETSFIDIQNLSWYQSHNPFLNMF